MGERVVNGIPREPPDSLPRPDLIAKLDQAGAGVLVLHSATGTRGVGTTQLAAAYAQAKMAAGARLGARNNLANAYRDVGRLEEAISLHEQTLAACERLLGADHPKTLGSRSNLATAYQEVGRVDEAIAWHERILAARERLLGGEHPSTLNSRNHLASAYQEAGRADDAIRLLEQTLAGREHALGANHPDTVTTRSSLALARENADRAD